MTSSSSAAPNAAANEKTTTASVKRTVAAALGPNVDPAPPVVKRRRLTFASPPPSSVKAAASSRRAVRGIRTPTRATSSSVKAASRASRSAGKAATPAVRGTPRTATSSSKHLEAKSRRRLRDDRISSLSKIKKEANKGRDASATVAARVLQEASIYDSVIRNTSEFSDICDLAKVSDPLPTVDPFLVVYQDIIQWKNIAESAASAELSSAKYWVGGVPHVVHELSLTNAPKTKSTTKERTAELAKNLCGQMQRWFLAFVQEALEVEKKWKYRGNAPTVLSQFKKISEWLEQVKHQIMEEEEEWTKEMIKRLERRIGDNLRRLNEWGPVPPRSRSRQSQQ